MVGSDHEKRFFNSQQKDRFAPDRDETNEPTPSISQEYLSSLFSTINDSIDDFSASTCQSSPSHYHNSTDSIDDTDYSSCFTSSRDSTSTTTSTFTTIDQSSFPFPQTNIPKSSISHQNFLQAGSAKVVFNGNEKSRPLAVGSRLSTTSSTGTLTPKTYNTPTLPAPHSHLVKNTPVNESDSIPNSVLDIAPVTTIDELQDRVFHLEQTKHRLLRHIETQKRREATLLKSLSSKDERLNMLQEAINAATAARHFLESD